MSKTLKLENGIKIEQIGFGTWPMKNEQCFEAVCNAIKIGYRHFDTAYHYQNEAEVGRAINWAINEGIVTRDKIFVTTKLADHHKHPGFPAQAVQKQLQALNLDYIDLYLIHSPW